MTKEPTVHSLSGVASTRHGLTSESVTIAVRTYFSLLHLRTAAHFTREATRLETTCPGTLSNETEPLYNEHRGYVVAAIQSSVAFLEATINEWFADARDNPQQLMPDLGEPAVALIDQLWTAEEVRIERSKTLTKYQVALILTQRQRFNTIASAFKAVSGLIDLRNALVHYKPEWVSKDEKAYRQKVAKDLRSKLKGGFAENRLYRESATTFFPDLCLGCGCAKWAVESSIAFTDEFYSRLGLVPRYEPFRSSVVA